MKKIFIISVMGFLALASCKKDYTCTCVTTFSDGEQSSSSFTITDKESDAEAACNEDDADYGDISTDCEIS